MALSLGFVLSSWSTTLVHPGAVVRTFLIALTLATLTAAVSMAITRDLHRGALVATAALAVVASKELIVTILRLTEAIPVAASIFIVASISAIALIGRMLLARGIPSARTLTPAFNLFFGLMLVVGAAAGVRNGLVTSVGHDLLDARSTMGNPHEGDPNIYVFLVDAYPASETLTKVFGFDNSQFLHELSARGFHVATDSRSNYWFTSLSLATLLYGEDPHDVDKFERVIAGVESPRPTWRLALAANPMFRLLHERGYQIAATSSGWTDVDLRSADIWLDSGSINDFESSVLRTTFVADLLDLVHPAFFAEQKLDRITGAFAAARSIAATDAERPTFAWIHVPAPHPPLAVAADGSLLSWPNSDAFFGITTEQMGVSSTEYKRLFTDQLAYVNQRLLEAVDAIGQADPDAVVIVMSDHGPGNPEDRAADSIDVAARLRNLFAAKTPSRDTFGNLISPVNVLPAAFNNLFDADLPLNPDTSYSSTMFGSDAMFRHLERVSGEDLN